MENSISFYSTNLQSPNCFFRQALLQGHAPDKGLYLPVTIPVIPYKEIISYGKMPYYEIAYHVTRHYLSGEIPDNVLKTIVKEAYVFEVPLEHVTDRKFVMRLDQGPTASFKDFAARMMGRLMQYFLQKEHHRLLILTATSGDTGSAVANAFYGLDTIDIVVLFPKNEVTPRQRKQMTILGKNVHVLAFDAKFDDCQSLVKQAFADPDLKKLNLSSANSINIGRLVPQIVYYFYAWAWLHHGDEKAVYSVPSGNFGDMMGGVLAMKMGLPVQHFVIATNENDEFPQYLKTGQYQKIEPSRNCISSAMNVCHPSNLARLVALYGGQMDEKGLLNRPADLDKMRKDLWSISISDTQTRQTISNAYRQYGTLFEPHGAVGWAGLMEYLRSKPEFNTTDQLCISLETAHPAKFPEEIEKILSIVPTLPSSLEGIDSQSEFVTNLEHDYQAFKEYLLKFEERS